VITACGIILAGTFATLMTAPLQVVLQIGTAIAVGVLIDTFVVRALLVPALATLAGRWSWWPSSLFKKSGK
jgi:RND superfamily putative drug exporter